MAYLSSFTVLSSTRRQMSLIILGDGYRTRLRCQAASNNREPRSRGPQLALMSTQSTVERRNYHPGASYTLLAAPAACLVEGQAYLQVDVRVPWARSKHPSSLAGSRWARMTRRTILLISFKRFSIDRTSSRAQPAEASQG